MSKSMMPYKIENWKIVGVEEVNVLNGETGHRFVVGTYEGRDIRTSYIVHDGSPNYVETCNSIYGLGEPASTLTPIQNQAVAVAKKAIVDAVKADKSFEAFGSLGSVMLEDSAQVTAHVIVKALAQAALLVK